MAFPLPVLLAVDAVSDVDEVLSLSVESVESDEVEPEDEPEEESDDPDPDPDDEEDEDLWL